MDEKTIDQLYAQVVSKNDYLLYYPYYLCNATKNHIVLQINCSPTRIWQNLQGFLAKASVK